MRWAWLFALGSCSALVPSARWHPRVGEDGRPSCAYVGYPIADAVLAVPALSLGGFALVHVNTTPVRDFSGSIDHGLWSAVATVGLIAGTVWAASAFYGFAKHSDCHEELAGIRPTSDTASDSAFATP